jgi:hypothetical protein
VDAGYITPAESLVSIGIVPNQGAAPPKKQSEPLPEKAILKLILREINAAWSSGKPWSNKPQTKNEGRYAPAWLEKQWGIKEKVAMKLIDDWLYNKILAFEEVSAKSSKKGLKVIGSLE